MLTKTELQKVRESQELITRQRFCSNCQQRNSTEGGKWHVFNGGKNRRWKCQACVSRREQG